MLHIGLFDYYSMKDPQRYRSYVITKLVVKHEGVIRESKKNDKEVAV
ncbi:MAG: hypothetical protein ACXVIW_01885 [Halobacteriota archaeon]